MTDLEKRKEQEQRLQRIRPELRSRQQMGRYRAERKRRDLRVTAVILAAVTALLLFMLTMFLREKTALFARGVPTAYWIACALAFALSVLSTVAFRKAAARRERQDDDGPATLTEESLIRDGKRAPLIAAGARAVPLLLFLLWLLKNKLPEPAAAAAYPFIIPIAYWYLVASQMFPLHGAKRAARLGYAIRQGDYQITEDLLCDREHIVIPGRQDENDKHEYYLFYRSGLTGKVEREQVFNSDYEQTEIGQVYYRFQQNRRKLKVVDRRRVRLDGALRTHLLGGTDPAEPVSVEDEEIRRQVDCLRVGEGPEPSLGPVPEDMDPRELQMEQNAAAVWLRKYDRAKRWITGIALLNLLLIVAGRVLRHIAPRRSLMGSYSLLLMIGVALAAAFLEVFLMVRCMRCLERAKAAFPYENGELQRREAVHGRTVLTGILGFLLFFGMLFAVIF